MSFSNKTVSCLLAVLKLQPPDTFGFDVDGVAAVVSRVVVVVLVVVFVVVVVAAAAVVVVTIAVLVVVTVVFSDFITDRKIEAKSIM